MSGFKPLDEQCVAFDHIIGHWQILRNVIICGYIGKLMALLFI